MALFLGQAARARGSFETRLGLEFRHRHIMCRKERGIVVITMITPQLFEDIVADGLQEELLGAAAQAGRCHVVLDLQDVQAVSREAIGRIAHLHEFVQERGCRLVLSGVCPCVAEAFHLARLAEETSTIDLLLPTQPDIASAISWLNDSD